MSISGERAAALWMCGALASFVGAAVSIRELSGALGPFEIGIVRTGGGLILMLAAVAFRPGLLGGLALRDVPAHLPRNVVHFAGGVFWTKAIAVLPLATVFSLEFTAPAWAALLAAIVLREIPCARTVAGIAGSIAGVVLITKPDLAGLDVSSVLPLAAAACFGGSAVLTRRLSVRYGPAAILLMMMALQLPANAVGALWLPGAKPGAGSPLIYCAMATLCLAGLASQVCLTRALACAPTAYVMLLDVLRVPLIAAVGALFYSETPDFRTYAGAAVIIASLALGLRPARR